MNTASMRPRVITRGNNDLGVQPGVLCAASMRPRVITRGNAPDRTLRRILHIGFNEAAGDHPRKCTPGICLASLF